MDTETLDEILGSARANNSKRNVTGMLLFHDGSFIQVLEGDQGEVERLYEKIRLDPRHSGESVVLRTEVEERAFDGWSMGYKRATTLDDVPEGFHHFLQSGYRRQTGADSEAARRALLAFKDGRWRA